MIFKVFNRMRGRWTMIAHAFEAFTLLAVVFLAGYVVGQWVGTENSRTDANMEIERLSKAHSEALGVLTRSTARAAVATESAAVATESAATAVEAAASATTQAARTATQAAKAVGAKPLPPSATQINKSVEQANERLKKP